ncbi:MAG: hypothetical protein FJX34_06100, partial [Alphaproteobacteria bacterium]|nr:hypothetical protein [Alphaproteobacteria bacterium]
MFSEKNIVITIGNYGTIVTLHSGRKTDEKFFEDLNDDAKSQLTEFFGRRKSLPIYILLDTIDQSYKKKIYPAIKISDLKRIAKRDMMSDGDSSSIKNYMLINNKSITKQANKRLECLFVSSSDSDMINKWIDFLIELQNHLIGIYMSPVESFNLFKLLKTNIKMQSKVRNKKNDLYCLVIQNKVSGIRQIVFSGQGIVFTRVVNYNFDQNDFLEKYEHDLYSTFEYLKRIYPSLAMAELDIINILPGKALDKLINNNNSELNLVNYTPNDVATKISYPSLASNDYCDTLVSKAFSEGKKILRFTIPKISSLEKFFLALNASYYINLVVVVGIF